jgi:hypothetical protein
MDMLHTVETGSWNGPFSDQDLQSAVAALEDGKVIHLPHLAFALDAEERALLSPDLSDKRAKNVSLDPSGKLKHTTAQGEAQALLTAMMQRFARESEELVSTLFPAYRGKLERARTSYRPSEIEGRRYSALQDDTRLHVDAFPTVPMRGRRILRLFTNIHPGDRARVWNVGEPFAAMARKLMPQVREPVPARSWLLAMLRVTRGARAPYDDVMLGLHDAAKLDKRYQESCPKQRVAFAPGSTWLCYTDQVMHAALKGQFVLEQTFHLGTDAMATPQKAPIAVLETLLRRKLA